jgi:phospholipase C
VTGALGLAVSAVLVALAPAASASAASDRRPTTPIEHFVVLMQENHSFDNYFGTFRGADGIPKRTCMPVGRARPGANCVRPFRLGGRAVPDLLHDARTHRIQRAGGRMDGFVRGASMDRQAVERSVMGHYDGRDLPFYWNIAEQYVLFDRFFAATPGGSVSNHLAWVAGTPGGHGEHIPSDGYSGLPTIFDRLERRGVSWKFYVQDYDPRLNFGAAGEADQSAQSVRVPLLNYPRYVADRRLFSHIVDLEEYYRDLEYGTLPQVAYIAPAGAAEHPPTSPGTGETLVRSLLTALARSDAWESSAFMWTYDEWGGWFDHVRPPAGYGFRVPALLVSPYARKGFVDSTTLDTTSILRFIQKNWGLAPLARRDARAGSLAGAFDFSRPPREATIISAARGPYASPTEPRRLLIYLWYGLAVVLSAVLIAQVARRRRAVVPLQMLVMVALVAAMPAAAGAQAPKAIVIPSTIQTVPEVPGMRFSANGIQFRADGEGRAHPPPGLVGSRGSLRAIPTEISSSVRARFDRWYRGRAIAAVNLDHRVELGFVDLDGNRVDPSVVQSATLTGSNGRRHVLDGETSLWLQGNRVVPETQGRKSTAVSYAVDEVVVGGSTVVHRAQQRFFPADGQDVKLRLLLFSARFEVRDALLGFPIGSAVRLEYPNGEVQSQGLGPGADLTVRSLPRGDYRVSVDALGISSSRPVALSADQRVELKVISWLDIAVVLLGLASIALGLLYLRRPSRARAAAAALVLLAVASTGAPSAAEAADRPDPLFAYYYIWFNGTSWDRAKKDYPLLGRYSSDDRGVMRRHVQWAKRAGIDGFIVSWKSTPVLNRRLERLAEVAEAERFKLLVIYQGLDFYREPLPAHRIARDLDHFRTRFAADEAFDVFEKPVVIWSGTWRFSRTELAEVTEARREDLLILASERNVEGYRRLAGLVDGNAYYWAAVNPATYPGYPRKLAELGEVVHAHGGIWIPPAAPGFDARDVGGTSVVERRDGATLRTELDAATSSAPDAVGLISWNEFSENTHIEPSLEHGSRYLDVVADVRSARLPQPGDFDSSEPAATDVNYGVPLIGAMFLFALGGVGLLLRQRLPIRR